MAPQQPFCPFPYRSPEAGRWVWSLVPLTYTLILLWQVFKTQRGLSRATSVKGAVGVPATSGLRFPSIYPGIDFLLLIRGETGRGHFVVCLHPVFFLPINCQERQDVFATLSLYQSPRQLMTLYWAFIVDLLGPRKSIVFHYRVRLGHWSVNELLQSLYKGEPDQSIAADKRRTP